MSGNIIKCSTLGVRSRQLDMGIDEAIEALFDASTRKLGATSL